MDAILDPVAAALGSLEDGELAALIDTTHNVPQTAPGLLAWIEHAGDWELNRRAGGDFPLQPPDAAIPPEEDAVSIEAAMALHARFGQDAESGSHVVVLFDAILSALSGGARRH